MFCMRDADPLLCRDNKLSGKFDRHRARKSTEENHTDDSVIFTLRPIGGGKEKQNSKITYIQLNAQHCLPSLRFIICFTLPLNINFTN